MKKRGLWDFIVFMPFAMAIGSFIIYISYYFKLKTNVNSTVILLLQMSINNYRNITIFCLIFGIALYIIRKIILYFNENNEASTKHDIFDMITTKDINSKRNIFNTYISTKRNEEDLINNMLRDKTIKIKFLDSDIKEKVVRFKNYSKSENELILIDISDKNIKKEDILNHLNTKNLVYCTDCNHLINKDFAYCSHCGSKVVKNRGFNPLRSIINVLIVLLIFMIILFGISHIKYQNDINKSNMNIKTVETI